MDEILTTLQDQVWSFPLSEGTAETGVSGVTACRSTAEVFPMPESEDPYLFLVVDGSIRLYTPSGILDYGAGQYSISKIDTPLSGKAVAFSQRGDLLLRSISFTAHDVISVVLDLEEPLLEKITSGTMGEEDMVQADRGVFRAVSSLLAAREQPVWSEFLRKNRMWEVLYWALCGSSGRQLLQSVADIGPTEEIYAANSWIKEHFRSSFTVEELAERRNMSVSLFHQKFKRAVGMGPLQCQKRLRLTEARRLMLDENQNVTQASAEVGYESLSQFIRDYRKMFGLAPKEDIQRLTQRLQK